MTMLNGRFVLVLKRLVALLDYRFILAEYQAISVNCTWLLYSRIHNIKLDNTGFFGQKINHTGWAYMTNILIYSRWWASLQGSNIAMPQPLEIERHTFFVFYKQKNWQVIRLICGLEENDCNTHSYSNADSSLQNWMLLTKDWPNCQLEGATL